MTATLKIAQHVDPKTLRMYVNDTFTVYHCHHYTTLFTQLAEDAKELKGSTLMVETAEFTFHAVLTKYFADNGISDPTDRASIAEQYFSFVGLGEVKVSVKEGSAEMAHSHVDEGWISKWGKRTKPVNFIGQGFLAGAFAAIMNSGTGSYAVTETQSIVSGAGTSKFSITKR